MAGRRSLTTTTAAAGAVLFALCFVPSASATTVAHATPGAAHAATAPGAAGTGATAPDTTTAPTGLADTGAMNTTPYLVGGTGFLAVGAALVLVARRRALLLG